MKDPEESLAEDKHAFFVGYREVRSNDKKTTKVYLTRAGVTAGTGTARSETLAAVGENTSSAVVRFRNASNFTEHGSCRTDSKKELYTWLDGIVAEGIARSEGMDTKGAKETGGIDGSMTQGQGQGQGQGDPHPPNPSNAPSLYANHSSEKFVFPDGRRGIRFFLIDAEGNAQCAVVGEERDTRDGEYFPPATFRRLIAHTRLTFTFLQSGHYVYRKEAGFAFGPPLVVGNLIGVNRWLRDACVAGGAGSGSISFGSHPPKKGGFGASARGQVRIARFTKSRLRGCLYSSCEGTSYLCPDCSDRWPVTVDQAIVQYIAIHSSCEGTVITSAVTVQTDYPDCLSIHRLIHAIHNTLTASFPQQQNNTNGLNNQNAPGGADPLLWVDLKRKRCALVGRFPNLDTVYCPSLSAPEHLRRTRNNHVRHMRTVETRLRLPVWSGRVTKYCRLSRVITHTSYGPD